MQIQTFVDPEGNEHIIVVTPRPEGCLPICGTCCAAFKAETQVGGINAEPCAICKRIQYKGNWWATVEAVVDLLKDDDEIKAVLI